MTIRDLFTIGIPALLGVTLLSHSIISSRRNRGPGDVRDRLRTAHQPLNDKILEYRPFRFPGVRLVDPLHPWLLSETVFLLVLVTGGISDRTGVGVLKSIVIASILGIGTGWFLLRSAARKAIHSARRDLPVASFLFSLLLESGMGASSALQETASAIPVGTLSLELGELTRMRTLGVPRAEAIALSRERLPLEEYHLFLNHVSQGERLGIGLSRSLRELSSKMLESLGHRAETAAQQAAVKMLFPLVFFIFPAVFLLILSPVLLGLREMLRG